jgi:CheY-like chemotaxis protein
MTHNPMRAPRILIIENDFLIGEMLHDMVAELGYSVTKVAHGLPSALNENSKENFDGALVNIGIDDRSTATTLPTFCSKRKSPSVRDRIRPRLRRTARACSAAAKAVQQRAAARAAGGNRRLGWQPEPHHLARGLAQVAHQPSPRARDSYSPE